MRLLVLFATIEGHTGKVAEFVADAATRAGHEVELADASETAPHPDFSSIDKVVLAAPVHERRHPREFEAFVAGHAEALAALPNLFLSVSLNAAFPEGREEAEDYVIEFKMRTKFTPGQELLVAGAVRNAKYDFFARQVIRHVVLHNRAYDPDAEEYDFTDWDEVRRVLGAFLAA